MADLLEIREKLDDTNAAIARLAIDVAANPDVPSLRLTEASLRKRQKQLEAEFGQLAEKSNLALGSYRLIPDDNELSMRGFTTTLADFQEVFSVTFDAVHNERRDSAHLSAESVATSSFNFGYTFAGSVGVVFTAKKDSELFIGNAFEKAISEIADLAKASEPEDILKVARRLGRAPIRSFYKWAKDQIRFGVSSEIKWGDRIRGKGFIVQIPQLRVVSSAIDMTSEDEQSTISVSGDLKGADTTKKTFRMELPTGLINGTFSDAIDERHTVVLPRRYSVTLRITKRIRLSTEEETTEYFLVDLQAING